MRLYYIASLKHTGHHHHHIVWWGIDHRGYTPVVGPNIGAYSELEALKLNDGVDCIAVPIDVVQMLMLPQPFLKPGIKFYDQVGPVVPNNAAIWQILNLKRLAGGRHTDKIKPEPFKKKDVLIYGDAEMMSA